MLSFGISMLIVQVKVFVLNLIPESRFRPLSLGAKSRARGSRGGTPKSQTPGKSTARKVFRWSK